MDSTQVMKHLLLTTIAQLQQQREQAHIVPAHALLTEIITSSGIHHPQPLLNDLCREGKLRWHRTLNDVAFTISKQ